MLAKAPTTIIKTLQHFVFLEVKQKSHDILGIHTVTMTQTIATLTKDIHSSGRLKTLYGLKGDKVTVLNYHGDVAICLGKNGTFPTNKINLTISQKQDHDTII